MDTPGKYRQKLTDEEKRAVLDRYWKIKDGKTPLSLVNFAGICGISYYVLRDWYRDPRFNRRWEERKTYSPCSGSDLLKLEKIKELIERRSKDSHPTVRAYNGDFHPLRSEPFRASEFVRIEEN